jgi:undecaprenyl-diphosphatase
VIQAGAILAVVGLYHKTVLRMLRGVLGKDNAGFMLLVNLIIAFVPAAAIGFLLDDWIEAKLFKIGPVLAALLLGGIFMIVLDVWRKGRLSPPKFHSVATNDVFDVSPKQALTVGLLQVLAMWPGTSRSMMTMTGGIIAGMSARCAAEFSFLLGVLTLCAASAYKLLKNLMHAHKTNTPNLFETLGVVPVLVGVVVAAVSAAIAVKWLVGFLTKHGLAPFGWYRIALALALAVLAWKGLVRV